MSYSGPTFSDFVPIFSPAVAAEFIGSFLLQFLSGAAAANAADNGLAAAALGTGFAMGMLVLSTAHISGGHLNPAVTAGYMVTKANGFTIKEGISYILAQCLAAGMGSFLLRMILPTSALLHPFVTIGSLSDKHWGQVMILEFICTFLVVLVIFSTITDKQRSIAGNAGPLAVGFAYAVGTFAEGPLTGASMNPSRTIGAATAFGYPDHILEYVVATVLGGICAALGYKALVGLDETDDGSPLETPAAAPSVAKSPGQQKYV